MEGIIQRCVAIKKKFVEEDELDTGVRQLLNFGHTIGHAIEKGDGFCGQPRAGSGQGNGDDVRPVSRTGMVQPGNGRADHQPASYVRFDLTVAQPGKILYDICMADKKEKRKLHRHRGA